MAEESKKGSAKVEKMVEEVSALSVLQLSELVIIIILIIQQEMQIILQAGSK